MFFSRNLKIIFVVRGGRFTDLIFVVKDGRGVCEEKKFEATRLILACPSRVRFLDIILSWDWPPDKIRDSQGPRHREWGQEALPLPTFLQRKSFFNSHDSFGKFAASFLSKSVRNRVVFNQFRGSKLKKFSRRRKPWLRLLTVVNTFLALHFGNQRVVSDSFMKNIRRLFGQKERVGG